MITFKQARLAILKNTVPLPPQKMPLESCAGHVLAEDLTAPIDLPPFDNSAMDGVAISMSSLQNLSHGSSACNKIPALASVGQAYAGMTASQIIKAGDAPGRLERGTCAKIMTGAAVPEGSDCVIPIEDLDIKNNEVILSKTPVTGQHIRKKGEDVKAGEIAAPAGRVITFRHIALFAAMGITHVNVYRAPRVSIITTGNELSRRGSKLPHGKIYDSNSPALAAALKGIDIEPSLFTVPDDEQSIYLSTKKALEDSDVILTVGGISVGDYDIVKKVLEKLEVREIFHKVAIKPGKPLYFGTRGNQLIFGLPGNPVSALITFAQFVRPAILAMMGHKKISGENAIAVAAERLKGSCGKTVFLKGIYDRSSNTVMSAGDQGSAMLKSFSDSNCMIIIPEERDFIEAGEKVEVYV